MQDKAGYGAVVARAYEIAGIATILATITAGLFHVACFEHTYFPFIQTPVSVGLGNQTRANFRCHICDLFGPLF